MGWEEKLLPASSESLVSGSLQTRPQKHKKMLHHIRAAGPLPHSHPSPWRPSLQALGPPIWAVSAGWSHPELSEWMLLASPPHPRLELWVWAGTVALDCPPLGVCHTGFPSGAMGKGKGDGASCAHILPQKQQAQGVQMCK